MLNLARPNNMILPSASPKASIWRQFSEGGGWGERFRQNMGKQQPLEDEEVIPIGLPPMMKGPVQGTGPQLGIGGMPRMGQMPQPQLGIDGLRQRPELFKGFMAHGGRLRPGQWGIVGEDGPEMAKVNPDGTTEIVPLDGRQPSAGATPTFASNRPNIDPQVFQGQQVQTLGGTESIPNGVDPNIAQLEGIGEAASTNTMFRDPSRYNMGQPMNLGAQYQEPPAPAGGGMPSMPDRTDYGERPPLAPGQFEKSIPGMQQNVAALDEQIAKTQAGKDGGPREKSLWKRFGKGLVDAYKNWDGQGGLVGLGVATLGGGIGSAASPQAHQVGRLKTQKNQIFKKLGQQYQMTEQDNKLATQDAQIANYGNQMQNRDAQTLIDAEKVKQTARNAKVVERNGKVYRQYADGKEVLAPEIPSSQVKQKLADGSEVWVDMDKALSADAQKAYQQARLEFDTGKLNADSLEEYRKSLVKYSGEISEHQGKVSKLILDGQAKQNEAAEFDAQANDPNLLPSEKLEARAKATKLRSEGNALVNQGNEMRNNAPKPPPKPAANMSAPTIGAKTVTMSELQAIAAKTGKSIADVKKMMPSGYRVQE